MTLKLKNISRPATFLYMIGGKLHVRFDTGLEVSLPLEAFETLPASLR